MPYRVNGEIISLADSAADRADTGYDFEIEGSATAALMLTEADQVDPAGRYRLIVTGDLLLIQRAASGAWATAETLHTFNTVVQSVGDDIVFGFGLPDVRISWDTTDANANELLIQLPAGTAVNVPVIIIGQAIESVDPGLYNGVVDPRIAMFGVGAVTTGPVFEFRKARGSFTSPTVVTSGDDLGTIRAFGAVAAAEWVQAAEIRFDMAGTIATTRGPGTITFLTATDAAPSVLTQAMIISAAQLVTLTAGRVTGDLYLNLTLTAGTDGVGAGGEQLTSGGAAAECTWAAAASQRETKDIIEVVNDQADEALEKFANLNVYDFKYNRKVNKGTGDFDTTYRGIMADEAPDLMHYAGSILNPISTFGETVLAIKGLLARIKQLEAQVAA